MILARSNKEAVGPDRGFTSAICAMTGIVGIYCLDRVTVYFVISRDFHLIGRRMMEKTTII